MSKTQVFIEKARTVHGDRYDYSKTVYVRSKEKLIITCKEHGDFEQRPNAHLSGHGCAACSFELVSQGKMVASAKVFIEKARAKHGDRYDYSKVIYNGTREKVIITCSEHGDFEQMAKSHLNGSGCAKCGFEKRAAKNTQKGKDSFIEKARAVHGDRYDYSETVYVIHGEKVSIACAKHGDFEQRPSDHLKGRGCAKCSGLHRYSTQEWVQEAIAVHGDRYDYSHVVYVRSSDDVIITCKKHGEFEQTPNNHLKGRGCPSCPARYDQLTNLYLMHNALGKVKVGYSIDIDKRIKELNRDAPFEAELLETWTLPDTPTVRKIESKVHRKLAKYHAGLSGFDGATEWFNTTPCHAEWVINKTLLNAI